jgi:DNA polymerase (family X)
LLNLRSLNTLFLSNREILSLLKKLSVLLDLYDENPFKVRSLSIAAFNLGRQNVELSKLSLSELQQMDGVGKSIAAYINEINQTGKLSVIQELEGKTPTEVLQLAFMKGVGPKKARALWAELGTETFEAVLGAAAQGSIAQLKGFGAKTQENIKEAIHNFLANKGKLHYADALLLAEYFQTQITNEINPEKISLTGALRRKLEIIDKAEILIATTEKLKLYAWLDAQSNLIKDEQACGPFQWQGRDKESELLMVFMVCEARKFGSMLLQTTGTANHLQLQMNGKMLKQFMRNPYETEEEIYQAAGIPYFIPELREGLFEEKMLQTKMPVPLSVNDLKGSIHNHSTWSDGIHSIEEMAQQCIAMGYEYLGNSDHSRTAVYANGLSIERVEAQLAEIDALNKSLKPFVVFKGIESDILDDGALDYPDEILMQFDFVVASIHAQMNMDINKATNRLIRAIENPFTTILGHPTGRLLLERPGYPIDHKAIIDACAANEVIIEINANPWRLDIDWRWLPYAIEKNVLISINPDAHNMDDLQMVAYGVAVARKAGLEKKHIFNALVVEEVKAHFEKRKARAAKLTGIKA